MNNKSIRKILIYSLVFSLSAVVCEGSTSDIKSAPVELLSASNTPLPQKKKKVSRPKSAKKVQKEADKKEKQQDKDYEKFVKENQKRSVEIQTPEVKERMKQNVKNSNASYKAKKKNNANRTKKAGRKYR